MPINVKKCKCKLILSSVNITEEDCNAQLSLFLWFLVIEANSCYERLDQYDYSNKLSFILN